jgi:CRISPR-associated protein Cas2
MQYVICYDIADDARRSRVSGVLLDFGPRVQESVFLANLDDHLADKMRGRLERLIDVRQDRLHVFALCSACAPKVWTVGLAEVPRDQDYYVL